MTTTIERPARVKKPVKFLFVHHSTCTNVWELYRTTNKQGTGPREWVRDSGTSVMTFPSDEAAREFARKTLRRKCNVPATSC